MAAALMSVAWGLPIDVQLDPWAEGEGEGSAVSHRPTPRRDDQVRRVVIPAWAANSPSVVAQDLNLAAAVFVHHEGLQLQYSGHYSFSFAAFVASFEALGARTVDLGERCRECKTELGAMKRFRAGLQLILTKESVDYKSACDAYKEFRSSTVHTGTLHGGEEGGVGTWISGNPFLLSDDGFFVTGELPRMRALSREAIESVLDL